ncbi:hypothetical protein [Corynebacterium sp.]|uniref:hypothetical protein n=1 Tax=Corynebacterium sp. TaxID=1720 RepID=UPI0028AF74D8|nr:hypothetical protein [Corynebacterium sp.]
MHRQISIAAIAAATTLTLAACGGGVEAADSTTQPQATSTTTEASDNGPIVDHITRALDKLDAPWGNVKYKGENEEAVATDVWDLDINERDSSILVFRDEAARKDWEQAVLWADGVSVAYDNVGISLNSKLGLEDSLDLAPKLAEELVGRVTTGDSDMFRDEDEWATEPSDGPNPTPAAAPAEDAPAPGFSCGDWKLYQAGTAIYTDGSTGYEESCYQPMMDASAPSRAQADAEYQQWKDETDPVEEYNNCVDSFGGTDNGDDGFDVADFCSATFR